MSHRLEAAPTFAGSVRQLWLSTAARLVLGGVLLYAGGIKALEPDAAVRAVQAYRLIPPTLDEMVGYGLPLIEVAVGILLIVGLGTRVAAWLAGVLLVVFVLGIVSAWARGLSIDCGCFGGGGDISPEGRTGRYLAEIVRDLALLGLAGWLAVFPASRWALDRAGVAGTGDFGLLDEVEEADERAEELIEQMDDEMTDLNHEAFEEPRA